MTTTEMNTATTFEQEWAERAAKRGVENGEPAWAAARRKTALAHARVLGFPKRNDELWRRTDFRTVETGIATLDAFSSPARARNIEDLPIMVQERLAGETGNVALVVQRDGAVVLEQTHPELEKQGVIVCSMERALKEHADRLKGVMGAALEPDYDWYGSLAQAIRSGGTFVYVPDNVEAAVPVRLFQTIDGAGRVTAPHSVVLVGRNAKATVVEEQLSETADGLSVHLGATEVFVGEGSKLVFATLQDWGRNVYHYSNQRAHLAGNAELQWVQTLLGARTVKTNSYFDLEGSGAQAFVNGFMFGDSRQHFHLHTLQRHRVPHTTSDLLIKGCLKERARSIYQGLIQVSEGAQRTDAYQANRNLLLSNLARADSIPGLEILANDVRCTHGATIGHVDPEQMHYLMARGVPSEVAQRLIVEGFFAPVLDRIPLESVREQLRNEIGQKIG